MRKLRSLLDQKKIGHGGTLDPLATGLLILCTGKYTKNLSSLQKQKKTYTGEIILGATRSSYDLETEIENTFETSHITEDLLKTVKKEFVGKINQVPPMFSAIKNASKIALIYLLAKLRHEQFKLFDIQYITPHLSSMGGIEISKKDYLKVESILQQILGIFHFIQCLKV